MMKTRRVAVTLTAEVVRELEGLRRVTGETRSALVRRAILRMTGLRSLKARVRRYVDGYRRRPEGEGEVAAATATAVQLLAQEP